VIEYAVHIEGGEVSECDCCASRVPTYLFRVGIDGRRRLCEFCSSTMASRHTEYPAMDQFSALRAEIWRAAGAVFNALDERRKRGDS
jgi:hypothetical protein